MEASIDADRLTEDQLLSWLGVLNDLRLVLGTRLEITEETPRPISRRTTPAHRRSRCMPTSRGWSTRSWPPLSDN